MKHHLIKYIGIVTICLVLPALFLFYSCKKDVDEIDPVEEGYKTENVIIIVMDGARYSETWGDNTHLNIPYLAGNIKSKGVVNSNFYNNGFTVTSPGHLAMISGQYYNLNNGGAELPPFPSIFQYFNQTYPNKLSWIIASKDKLEVLTNTSQPNYKDMYLANTDCGIAGLGTGYREDSVTLYNAKNILNNDKPSLVLINFKDPDSFGHANDWTNYLFSIRKTDNYINQIIDLVETSSHYKDKTTIFITNDHGRHDDLNGGFQSHGDNCNGCRHIMFFGYGPDFKNNVIINTRYELIDIAQTTAFLLNIELPNSQGILMEDLFETIK
ncbi:MAG: sulfatase-like hydrolase/transferase [Flavobacteriales bacterium]